MKIEPKHANCPTCGEPMDHLVVTGDGKQQIKSVAEDGTVQNDGKPKIDTKDLKLRLGPKGRLLAKCVNGHHWWAVRLQD